MSCLFQACLHATLLAALAFLDAKHIALVVVKADELGILLNVATKETLASFTRHNAKVTPAGRVKADLALFLLKVSLF